MNCNYYTTNLCRSCDLLPLGLIEAAKEKEAKTHTLLGKFLKNCDVEDIIIPIDAFGSRSKGKIAIAGTSQDPHFGFFSAEQQMQVIEACPLHYSKINEVIAALKKFIIREKMEPYNLSTHKGELKGLVIATTQDQKSTMVRIILRSRALEEKFKKIKNELLSKLSIDVLTLSIQPHHQAQLDGETEIILTDEKYIWERYGSIQVALAPKSFFQVTPEVATKLYQTASEWIKESEIKNLLELYSGAGAFTLSAADSCSFAVGIDITEDAIVAAKISAKKNGFSHLSFQVCDLENAIELPSLESPQCVIVNPPRRGLSDNVITFLLEKSPSTIIYSSCNPITLAKDLESLSCMYTLSKLQCFDMFPLTSHVETLCQLKKIDS